MRALLFLALVGCAVPEQVDLGVIAYSGASPNVVLPDRVMAGEPATFTVYTNGGGCTAFDSTEIDEAPDGFLVIVYDRTRTHGACTANLVMLAHDAVLTFPAAGRRTVHVQGVGQRGDTVDLPFDVVVE